MRALRLAGILMAVLFLAVTVGPVAERGAYAGGGKDDEESKRTDYQVTVRNNTQSEVTVGLYEYGLSLPTQNEKIYPGQTHTFQTTDRCPEGLRGIIYFTGKEGHIASVTFYSDLLGREVIPHFFTESCWDSSWRITFEGTTYHFRQN